MDLNQLDILVKDVPQASAKLESLLGLSADYQDEHFAQFTVGSHCLMLSDKALIPLKHFQSGIILHVQIEDVDGKYQALQATGAVILNPPTETDWGTYSLLVQGPEGLVLDFYQLKEA
ncbi:VOC family protein [Streptococcus ovuberis]|uniref:VOC family protein n=1 Tax=Streptococcus ovuberis TaxID=1936207 RepID=A0A7X6MY93_9STRE|nr:VOC family protein [Streptococcus ovuberis]NKZ19678.1 VOC family protein [Streptococcus ovuberis]